MFKMMNIVESHWNLHLCLLVTRLQGRVESEDVERWAASLNSALDRIEAGGTFKLIVNLHGYESANLQAHKAMRSIIPLTLAEYGLRTALLDLFPPVDPHIQRKRGIVCLAVAHVHHDDGKMQTYARQLGRHNEQFFSDEHAAEIWIASV
jgi:hypothetical protein